MIQPQVSTKQGMKTTICPTRSRGLTAGVNRRALSKANSISKRRQYQMPTASNSQRGTSLPRSRASQKRGNETIKRTPSGLTKACMKASTPVIRGLPDWATRSLASWRNRPLMAIWRSASKDRASPSLICSLLRRDPLAIQATMARL